MLVSDTFLPALPIKSQQTTKIRSNSNKTVTTQLWERGIRQSKLDDI